MTYEEWTPWSFHDNDVISSALETMPVSPSIPRIVHLFENPNSPIYLPGPTLLNVHDVIHVLLGRGLLNQDEAFVVGFCMGASKSGSNISRLIFEFIGKKFYPGIYRFSDDDFLVFDIAFDAAHCRQDRFCNIHLLNYHSTIQKTIFQAREEWGLTKDFLINLYKIEKRYIPQSYASQRLPI